MSDILVYRDVKEITVPCDMTPYSLKKLQEFRRNLLLLHRIWKYKVPPKYLKMSTHPQEVMSENYSWYLNLEGAMVNTGGAKVA